MMTGHAPVRKFKAWVFVTRSSHYEQERESDEDDNRDKGFHSFSRARNFLCGKNEEKINGYERI
jgi:hypothetical protein